MKNAPYFRRLIASEDFAKGHAHAERSRNVVYLLGDPESHECVVIDPAYAIDELLESIEADGMRLVGALATHYHADHVGGDLMLHARPALNAHFPQGHPRHVSEDRVLMIEGVRELAERAQVPIHTHEAELEWMSRTTGVSRSDLALHGDGDSIGVGGLEIELIHAPGHSAGGLLFKLGDWLFTGDTLQVHGCGRADQPTGSAEDLYRTALKIRAMPGQTVILPGHNPRPPDSISVEQARTSIDDLNRSSADEFAEELEKRFYS